MVSKYCLAPLSDVELAKVSKMMVNGCRSFEEAKKTRYALRRKRRVLVVES